MNTAGIKSLTSRTLSASFCLRATAAMLWVVASLTVSSALAQDLSGLLGQAPAEKEPAVQPGAIVAEGDSVPSDEAIAERLNAIFSEISGLREVQVTVADGVVSLRGTVIAAEQRERAAQLAERVFGTVLVLNEITVNRSVKTRLKISLGALRDQLRDLAATLPLILLALVVIGLAVALSRLLGRADRIYERLSKNWFIRDLWRQLIQFVVIAGGVVMALSLLDATALLGSLVGAMGIVGLAIGFATRDTVENYIASILLSLRQPFAREDAVLINDIEGKVIRLTSRATILMSLDGNHIRIPNSVVYKATIVNYTRNPLRRFQFTVGVDTEIELTRPRELAVETLARVPGVLASPPPVCLVDKLGDSSVILLIQGWIDQRDSDFLKARSEAQRLVKEAFDDAGIVMPEPIYNVNLREPRAAATTPMQEAPRREQDAGQAAPESLADTTKDETVDVQIRAETTGEQKQNLLSETAPLE